RARNVTEVQTCALPIWRIRMSTRTRTGLAALAIPALVLTACGGDDSDSTEPAADSASTVTITDSRGEQEVPVNPERVVVYDIAKIGRASGRERGETRGA